MSVAPRYMLWILLVVALLVLFYGIPQCYRWALEGLHREDGVMAQVDRVASEIALAMNETTQAGGTLDQGGLNGIIANLDPAWRRNVRGEIVDIRGHPLDIELASADSWVLLRVQNQRIRVVSEQVWHAKYGWVVTEHDWRYSSKHRRQGKDAALVRIGRVAQDADWLKTEMAAMNPKRIGGHATRRVWLSDHLIVMENREWIIYASHCDRENVVVYDIFVGRGSDGNWYYSSYHFHTGMIDLAVRGQPADLSAFARGYYLRQFDGKSDEALGKTWP